MFDVWMKYFPAAVAKYENRLYVALSAFHWFYSVRMARGGIDLAPYPR